MLMILFLQVGVGFLAQYLIKPMLGFAIVMVFFVITWALPCFFALFRSALEKCYILFSFFFSYCLM